MGRGPCSHESYAISDAQGVELPEGNSGLTVTGRGGVASGGVFDHGTHEEDGPATWEEQPTRLRVLWGESPLSSIARFGRLVYPGHGEVTNRGVLGSKSHGCSVLLVWNCGRSDLGGEQTWGPEHNEMTAASLEVPY